MGNIFRKAVIAGAVALAFSGSAFAVPTTISNGLLSATVNDSGTFSSLAMSGTEFINWGTPLSYYWLNSSSPGSPFIANNATSTNPLLALTSPVSGTVTFTGANGGLTFNQTVSLIANKAVVSVVLSNSSSSAVTGVQWGVGMDPDQGMPVTFNTDNSILAQGAAAAAMASDPNNPNKSVTLRNTTSAGAFTIRSYIDTVCCAPVNPGTILGGAAQAVGSYGVADKSISLAYDIGTINASSSATIGYEYVFAVPEPDTYAMLLAGLGLMGFVARRRKQKTA